MKTIGSNHWLFGGIFSPNGKLMAATESPSTSAQHAAMVHLYTRDGGLIKKWFTHPRRSMGGASAVAFGPDGATIAVMLDDGLKIWNTSGALLNSFKQRGRFAFSPNGASVFIAADDLDDYQMFQYNRKGTLIRKWKIGFTANSMAINEQQIAVGSCMTMTIFNHTGSIVKNIDWSRDQACSTCLVYHPRKPLLAVALVTGYIMLWDTSTWRLHTEIKAHAKEVNAIAFNADGTRLLSCSYIEKSMKLWEIGESDDDQKKSGNGNNGKTDQ